MVEIVQIKGKGAEIEELLKILKQKGVISANDEKQVLDSKRRK